MGTLKLANEILRLEVVPDLGAGIASCEARSEDGWHPVMRPAQVADKQSALDLACVLMIPWTNRIFGGGFSHGGREVVLEPNLPENMAPLHGNALTSAWKVQSESSRELKLSLRSRGPDLFDYSATVSYALSASKLTIGVGVQHEGEQSLPYGLGVHPWFVRTPQTTLQAVAKQACLVDGNLAPTGYVDIASVPEWDFSTAKALPDSLIDNSFTGWDGTARLGYPELGIDLKLGASRGLSNIFQFYSPGPGCGFVCFEPVSHLVDEHNMPGRSENHGLVALGCGESMEESMTMEVEGL